MGNDHFFKIICVTTVLSTVSGGKDIWSTVEHVLDKVAKYGYPLFGYAPPGYGYGVPEYAYVLPEYGYGIPEYGYGAPGHGYGAPGHAYGAPGHGYGTPEHGYGAPGHGHGKPVYKEDVHIPVDPGTLWNGHIPVGDFVSPIVAALGAGHGGYSNRVVKGYENRLGLRIALPYLGDFQVTRELGPGRFMDKLGPGKFPYPGLKGVQGSGHKPHQESSEHHHASSSPHKPDSDMYKGLKNYPWYRR